VRPASHLVEELVDAQLGSWFARAAAQAGSITNVELVRRSSVGRHAPKPTRRLLSRRATVIAT
jgi:hypothetical protein